MEKLLPSREGMRMEKVPQEGMPPQMKRLLPLPMDVVAFPRMKLIALPLVDEILVEGVPVEGMPMEKELLMEKTPLENRKRPQEGMPLWMK